MCLFVHHDSGFVRVVGVRESVRMDELVPEAASSQYCCAVHQRGQDVVN